jgi:hypothetical protein
MRGSLASPSGDRPGSYYSPKATDRDLGHGPANVRAGGNKARDIPAKVRQPTKRKNVIRNPHGIGQGAPHLQGMMSEMPGPLSGNY